MMRVSIVFILFFHFSVLVGAGTQLPQPVEEFLYAEQKLISREVDKFSFRSPKENDQNPLFTPEAGMIFKIKTFLVPIKYMHFFESKNISEEIRSLMLVKKNNQLFVRLMIHPESEAFYEKFLIESQAQRDIDFYATPTSSSRSLLVWKETEAEKPFIAKVSLDAEIGGVVRTIPLSEMVRSVGYNDILFQEKIEKKTPPNFDFFPETFSAIPQGFDRGALIIRELPKQMFSENQKIIPLFSLYAENKRGISILLSMLRKTSKKPYDFIEEEILRPFLNQFFELVIERAINMEPHAQNVLMVLNKNGMPTGQFIHRDLGGFGMDFQWRQKMNYQNNHLPYLRSVEKDYHQNDEKAFFPSLENTIHVFFNGGFVYNLDRSIEKWMDEGLIIQDERGHEYLRKRVFEILIEISKQKGYESIWYDHPQSIVKRYNFPDFVLKVRNYLQKKYHPQCFNLFEK